jgi:hypothetical protein
MLILGLLILVAAVVVGVEAVADNSGGHHLLAGGFNLFGYHLHGSSGRLFVGGVIVGVVGLLGLMMLAVGARRSARMRRELTRARRDARSQRTVPQSRVVEPEPELADGPDPVAVIPAAREADTPRGSGRAAKTPSWAAFTSRRSASPTPVDPETDAETGAGDAAADADARSTSGV